ncbi:APC family permease [Actinomadura montaniterrae]|uniref:Amino acid permease n=1 Tax=Actinomadura montaniterrae TaxID=1803903 RepID=A0A6L3W1E4_9ACTN|nr:APC family permease [Actinomadura montaniterrae]KAB2387985.1 amino acid permease [Actinomadura montaniterrae]
MTAPAGSGFERRLGVFQATTVNMTQMCGIGPFVTIPAMISTMEGPQAMFGWLVGALIVLADGLVWAELGASMPGAGGTYLYLREAFQYRTGRLMPFLFVWSAVLFIPLIMSTGVIGLVQYAGYLWPSLVDGSGLSTGGHVLAIAVVAVVVAALYRKIGDIGLLTTVFFVVMLVSVLGVILAAFTHFHSDLAFTYPRDAGSKFFHGLGAGLVIAVYDYLGYNTAAYLGAEVRQPGRVIPRAIIFSILGMMTLYFLLQVGILGVIPWEKTQESSSFASLVLERTWGKGAAQVFTVGIIVTAFASVFAGLLGGSRVPYNAARDKLFLPWFARLHPRLKFPTFGLYAMGVITAIGSLFTLTDVISMLTAVFVLVQSVAQVVALTVLRRRQPDLPRPYRMWLYPLPSLVALAGWIYIYKSAGTKPIVLSLVWLAAGVVAYLVWARLERIWPFGPKEISEPFTEPGGAEPQPA